MEKDLLTKIVDWTINMVVDSGLLLLMLYLIITKGIWT